MHMAIRSLSPYQLEAFNSGDVQLVALRRDGDSR
jgi:hypothetical protein